MDYRTRPTTWWLALVDWIDAADPGLVRRRAAARAALAALTAWVAVLGLTALPGEGMGRREALFAVTVCFVSAVVVVDARRTERRTTLLWSLPAWAGALLLAALLQPIPRALPVALLVLIFVSYATRRLGLRPGELALLVTMGVYFGGNADITWNRLPWFLVSVGIGVGSLWLWQFVLLPYDPVQSLRDSVRSFYDRAAGLVGAVGTNFDASTAALVAVEQAGDQQRRLRQIKLSRSVIESQFPGVLAPSGWQRDQINRLQLALYTAERGLALMVQGAGTRAQVAAIPTTLHEPLANGIDALHQGLSAGGQESLLVLAQQSELLRQRVETLGTARWQINPTGSPAPTAWATDGLRLVNGMRQVAASVTQVRTLVSQAGMPNAVADPMAVSLAPSPRPTPPPVRVLGRFNVHPTTALGIQAALATGLAMLAAMLLGIDHANWVFWTAFSVIAGSSGESVRKLALRVVGTVAGVVVGVAVALLGPESTWFVGPGAVICMFLTVYYRPVSYPKMVFWLIWALRWFTPIKAPG